jgi:4'-phosphopantetheinyl transferase
VDSRRIHDADLSYFAQQLGDDEKRRLANFVRAERQRQFLLGRVLLRLALARLVGVSPNKIEIIECPDSAPQVVLPDSILVQPGYSVSHSANWIACAVSGDATLGLDIELIDLTRDVIALSHAAFNADECIWLQHQPSDLQVREFYHLWSLKEALYKMRTGNDSDGVPSLVDTSGILLSQGEGWHSYALAHEDLSLVISSTQPLSTLQLLEPDELTQASWKEMLR